MGRNADIVRGIYDALGKGDVPAVLDSFDAKIQWREAENFLYADGNPYAGPQAVAQGVFQRLVADIDGFVVVPEHFVEGTDTVVVEGRYRERSRLRAEESTHSSPMCGSCATTRSSASSSTRTPNSGRKRLDPEEKVHNTPLQPPSGVWNLCRLETPLSAARG